MSGGPRKRTLRLAFVELLKHIFDVPDDARIFIYPDDKWHRVKITYPPSGEDDAIEDILSEWREYNKLALELPDAAASCMRHLSPQNITLDSIKTISMCLGIPDPKQARQLLREGAYFFGKHCRTSVYT
jgi:hypothetical protein